MSQGDSLAVVAGVSSTFSHPAIPLEALTNRCQRPGTTRGCDSNQSVATVYPTMSTVSG